MMMVTMVLSERLSTEALQKYIIISLPRELQKQILHTMISVPLEHDIPLVLWYSG